VTQTVPVPRQTTLFPYLPFPHYSLRVHSPHYRFISPEPLVQQEWVPRPPPYCKLYPPYFVPTRTLLLTCRHTPPLPRFLSLFGAREIRSHSTKIVFPCGVSGCVRSFFKYIRAHTSREASCFSNVGKLSESLLFFRSPLPLYAMTL